MVEFADHYAQMYEKCKIRGYKCTFLFAGADGYAPAATGGETNNVLITCRKDFQPAFALAPPIPADLRVCNFVHQFILSQYTKSSFTMTDHDNNAFKNEWLLTADIGGVNANMDAYLPCI